jgi:hypothetical protein
MERLESHLSAFVFARVQRETEGLRSNALVTGKSDEEVKQGIVNGKTFWNHLITVNNSIVEVSMRLDARGM